ncbi:hypothetical protein BC834DRAFT_849612 [Gloeopeniophorella convolvens]|nr:hypothetical protein BC834DRAFT_849612 [Gloeopeniophorella convolvens]
MSGSSPRLPRRSSTWSVLRSLETLSPPPSWPSLNSLATHCEVGNIPVILHSGVIINHESFGDSSFPSEQEDLHMRDLDIVATLGPKLDSEGQSYVLGAKPVPVALQDTGIPDKTSAHPDSLNDLPPLGAESVILSPQGDGFAPSERQYRPDSVHSCIYESAYPQEVGDNMARWTGVLHPKRDLIRSAPPAPPFEFALQPSTTPPSTPESSPNRALAKKLRSVVNKGFAHVSPRQSPPRYSPPGTGHNTCRSVPSSPEPRNPSPVRKSRGRKRNGSTSTTDSGVSNRSVPPLIADDGTIGSNQCSEVNVARFPLIPPPLSWLQSTALDLMIDQEGFRNIRPAFKLAGYSSPIIPLESGPVSPNVHLLSATADFMPVRREIFVFHHAALDTPPVLRRLTVDRDESRDYLSRQAYLTLKTNGPYSVQGTEPIQSPRLLPAPETPVLTWRFDYLVGDRRTETGRVIPGEKTLTPLSFSCSPALLQLTQARKIGLVHVMKKGVAAKLTATRMDPPAPPRLFLAPGSAPRHNSETEDRKAIIVNHRRVRSHAMRHAPAASDPMLGSVTLSASKSYHSSRKSYPRSGPPGSCAEPGKPIVPADLITALFPVEAV